MARDSEAEFLQRALDAATERYALMGDELDAAEMQIIDLQNELESDHDGHEILYTGLDTLIARLEKDHDYAHHTAAQWCPESACTILRELQALL